MSKFKLIILFLLGSSLWMRAQERMDEMWGDSKANISGSTKDYRLLTDGKYGMFTISVCFLKILIAIKIKLIMVLVNG